MKIICPQCASIYEVDSSFLGDKVKCFSCQADFTAVPVREDSTYEPAGSRKMVQPSCVVFVNPPFKTPVLASVCTFVAAIEFVLTIGLAIGMIIERMNSLMIVSLLFVGCFSALVIYGIGEVITLVAKTAYNTDITNKRMEKIITVLMEK